MAKYCSECDKEVEPKLSFDKKRYVCSICDKWIEDIE